MFHPKCQLVLLYLNIKKKKINYLMSQDIKPEDFEIEGKELRD